MNLKKTILILIMAFSFNGFSVISSNAGFVVFDGAVVLTYPETDGNRNLFSDQFDGLFYFFDLRDRETFIQLTYPDSIGIGASSVAHIQIFDVSNNCNENDFFDTYTVNDTHTYNMRDIQTNDGNPSGVVLPEGAYGIVAVTILTGSSTEGTPIGNLRILDANGYEYRTNAQGVNRNFTNAFPETIPDAFMTFNFNTLNGVTLSDVVGLTLTGIPIDGLNFEWDASSIIPNFIPLDVDIYDLNEVPFSCRDVIFACTDQDNPLLEELLEFAGSANVASFEYGINNAIPHSKGGELLCPGNNISEGLVKLNFEPYPNGIENFTQGRQGPVFLGYVGLNNGNERGSMDSFWITNFFTLSIHGG